LAGSGSIENRSSTSGSAFVAPHAIFALWPRMTPGTPGNETPATLNGQSGLIVRQRSPFMNQTDGIPIPRCGSFARRAAFERVFVGPTTQLFEPTWWSPAIPSAPSSPAISSSRPLAAATSRQAAGSPTEIVDPALGGRAAVPARSIAAFEPAPPEPFSPLGVMTGIVES
jgi:hypothetical protein